MVKAVHFIEDLELDDEFYEENIVDIEEGDLVTEDHVKFYCDGKLAFIVGEDEDVDDAVAAWMAEENYYPNVWFLSDHGNAHPIVL